MSNPTSNFGWVMPTSTDLVTDLPADFAVFGQGVDTTMADLKGGTSGQILSKATNTDMDFVWIANDQGDITGVTATSPLTGGGTSGAITVGIQDASTSQKGSVQLSDSTSTTSSVLAATPTAVKASYDLAAAAIPKSTVTAKGSIVAATASSTPAQLAVGNNGETLVADSAATTGLRYQGNQAAGRNAIINGGMDIWQRGTSFSSPNATYVSDRWKAEGSTPACTVSRQATGDTTNLPNIQYNLRFQRNSGQTSTNALYLYSGVETANAIPYAGKAIVVSFYARAGANYSSASSILSYFMNSGTGTDESPSGAYTGNVSVASGNVTLTTTWQRFTYTGTLGSTATEFKVGFNYTPVGTASTNDYFDITGVQVELGSVATPFSRAGATIQGELAACQRYYVRTISTAVFANYAMGIGQAGTTALLQMQVPEMRTAPTVCDFANLCVTDMATNTAVTAMVLDSNNTTPRIAFLNATVASGLTVQRPYILRNNNSSAGYVGIGAEL